MKGHRTHRASGHRYARKALRVWLERQRVSSIVGVARDRLLLGKMQHKTLAEIHR